MFKITQTGEKYGNFGLKFLKNAVTIKNYFKYLRVKLFQR
jgi:hypothetical protein